MARPHKTPSTVATTTITTTTVTTTTTTTAAAAKTPFRVAIIGGGIGGLSTALFLHEACGGGVETHIYEQARAGRDGAGAGIGLGVNATKLLHRVAGLGDACNAIAGSKDGVWFTLRRWDSGAEVTTVYSDDRGRIRQAAVARGELLRLLAGFVEKNGAGRVWLGKKFRGVQVSFQFFLFLFLIFFFLGAQCPRWEQE